MNLKAYVTTKGNEAITRLLAAQGALKITRAELGSGAAASEAEARARTSLISKTADASLTSCSVRDKQAAVDVQYVNTSQSADMTVRELGIYCADPSDATKEVLLCYVAFGDAPDLIVKNATATYTRVYRVYVYVSDLQQIEVNVSPAAMVSQDDLAAALAALKIPKIAALAVTLPADGWSEKTQTVSAAGVTADREVIVRPAPANYIAWQDANVYCSAQGAGSLTFTCEDVPESALTANVLVVEVAE